MMMGDQPALDPDLNLADLLFKRIFSGISRQL